jgi:hypothetical protein
MYNYMVRSINLQFFRKEEPPVEGHRNIGEDITDDQ